MNDFSNTPVMPAAPKPFFQVWIDALTKPNERTFAEMVAAPGAKATTAYIWVFVALLVELFFTSLVQGAIVRQTLQQQGLGGNLPGGGLGISIISAVCGAPIGAVIGTLFFAVWTAIVQWIAKMFGGRGTFDQLVYAFGAISAPYALFGAIFTLLGAIPFVGICFRVLLGLAGLYILVLNIMAVKGVNQFDWGPALGAIFIPALVIGFFCCCLIGVSAAVFGTMFKSILQQIQQGIGSGSGY